MKKIKKTASIGLMGLALLVAPLFSGASETSSFACCNSYMVDPETGESFVAVTVCKGGDSAEDYILACLEADAWRDAILSIAE